MLKHQVRNVPVSKRTPERLVPCRNVDALQQLNIGSLWVRLEGDEDVILYGASSEAWSGKPTEEFYIIRNGIEESLPASTKIIGFYEQRDLPPQYANIWDDVKERRSRSPNG